MVTFCEHAQKSHALFSRYYAHYQGKTSTLIFEYIRRCPEHVHYKGKTSTLIFEYKRRCFEHVHCQGKTSTLISEYIRRYPEHVHYQGKTSTLISEYNWTHPEYFRKTKGSRIRWSYSLSNRLRHWYDDYCRDFRHRHWVIPTNTLQGNQITRSNASLWHRRRQVSKS